MSNPYLGPYDHHLTDRMVTFDAQAYRELPGFRFVYDKLWVAEHTRSSLRDARVFTR